MDVHNTDAGYRHEQLQDTQVTMFAVANGMRY